MIHVALNPDVSKQHTVRYLKVAVGTSVTEISSDEAKSISKTGNLSSLSELHGACGLMSRAMNFPNIFVFCSSMMNCKIWKSCGEILNYDDGSVDIMDGHGVCGL